MLNSLPSTSLLTCLSPQISATGLIIVASLVGILWAYSQFHLISLIPVESYAADGEGEPLVGSDNAEKTVRLNEIYTSIYEGAESFLRAEYKVCFWFIIVVGLSVCLFFVVIGSMISRY